MELLTKCRASANNDEYYHCYSTVFYTDLFTSALSKINRYDIATGIGNLSLNQPFINDSELNGSLSLAVGSNGNLFVGVSGTNSVKRYDSQTGNFLGNFVGSGSGGLSILLT